MKFHVRLLAFLLLLPVSPALAIQPSGLVEVVVVDSFGAPVPAAAVAAVSLAGYRDEVVTDQAGRAVFRALVVGSYRVAAVAYFGRAAPVDIVVRAGSSLLVDVRIVADVSPGVLVRPVDPQGLALPGVLVTAAGSRRRASRRGRRLARRGRACGLASRPLACGGEAAGVRRFGRRPRGRPWGAAGGGASAGPGRFRRGRRGHRHAHAGPSGRGSGHHLCDRRRAYSHICRGRRCRAAAGRFPASTSSASRPATSRSPPAARRRRPPTPSSCWSTAAASTSTSTALSFGTCSVSTRATSSRSGSSEAPPRRPGARTP